MKQQNFRADFKGTRPSGSQASSIKTTRNAAIDSNRCPAPSSKSWVAMAAMTLAGFATQTAEAAIATPLSEDTPQPQGARKAEKADPRRTVVGTYSIPPGELETVLEELGKQTGDHYQYQQDNLRHIASPGVQGVFTASEALREALKGTGLASGTDRSGNIVLSPAGDNQSIEIHEEVLASPKFTASVLDLPQTLTVINQQVMQVTASSSLQDVLRTIPGITFGAGEGGNPIGDRPFIRGMDSQSSTYLDGMRDIGSQSREVFDIESIEVSEGPGGAYGGRGTGGGSINMNSKLARKGRALHGAFTPGTADYKRLAVDGNLPVTSSIAVRIAGVAHDAGVAGRDGAHNNRWGVAPSLALGLNKPTRAYLDYYHLISNNTPEVGIPYNNPAFVPRTDGTKQILTPGDGSPLALPNRRTYYGLLDRDKDHETARAATGRIERDLFDGHSLLRNSYRYERTSQDYIWTQPDDSKGNIYYGLLWRRPNTRVSTVFSSIDQADLSGQFTTGHVKHSYATGAEFSQERGNNDSYTLDTGTNTACPNGAGAASGYNCTLLYSPDMHDPWAGSIVQQHNPTHSKTVTRSVYAFDTLGFHPRFQSTLGLRYDNYDASFLSAYASGVRTSYSRTDHLVNYQAGAVYKPDPATSIYGTVSSASIPTGNALAQGSDASALNSTINQNLEPQKIRMEEVGIKRELPGGRALVRADFFYTDIDNVRIAQADGSVAAAGKNRTRGIQAGISGQLTKRWNAFGGYTWLDAILVSAGGSGAANGVQNGMSMPNTPEHSVSVTSDYAVLSPLRVGGGIYAMTKVWGSQANNKWVPGYVREDLFADYRFNAHINLQLNIQNLSNELYYDKAYPTHYAQMAPGRSALFGLNYNF